MKQRIADRLPGLAAALWWGSLSAIGFLVVPLLFQHLPTPAMAGGMAARLFTAQTWVSIACTLLLLMFARRDVLTGLTGRTHAVLVFIMLGLLLALLAEFGVAPRIVARENLRLWHTVGSAMYLVQWVCAAVVLWRLLGPRTAEADAFAEPPDRPDAPER